MTTELTFSVSPATLIMRASQEIEDFGGSLEGNNSAGKINLDLPFFGGFKGTYEIHAQKIKITINEKPSLVTDSMAGLQIRNFFRKLDY